LTASVFSKSEFKTWADDNVILLELDYPRRKTLPDEIRQQNAALQQAFKEGSKRNLKCKIINVKFKSPPY